MNLFDDDIPDREDSQKGWTDADVIRIYDAYPRKEGRPKALASIRTSLKKVAESQGAGDPASWLLAVVERYAKVKGKYHRKTNPFVAMPATFFNQDRFDDEASWGGEERETLDEMKDYVRREMG